jgi:hypothetical protein
MYTASITFFGRYRPAYFQADTVKHAVIAAQRAIVDCEQYNMLSRWLNEALAKVDAPKSTCSSCSIDWGCYGVSLRQGPHDPFLDRATADYPSYPGLKYDGACNV